MRTECEFLLLKWLCIVIVLLKLFYACAAVSECRLFGARAADLLHDGP
jgi:hypothetical protein